MKKKQTKRIKKELICVSLYCIFFFLMLYASLYSYGSIASEDSYPRYSRLAFRDGTFVSIISKCPSLRLRDLNLLEYRNCDDELAWIVGCK